LRARPYSVVDASFTLQLEPLTPKWIFQGDLLPHARTGRDMACFHSTEICRSKQFEMRTRVGYISASIIQLGYIQQHVMVVQECVTQTELKSNDGSQTKSVSIQSKKSMENNHMSPQERIYRTYVQIVQFCENPPTSAEHRTLRLRLASHHPRLCAGTTLLPMGSMSNKRD
jgi:hypothetical protein